PSLVLELRVLDDGAQLLDDDARAGERRHRQKQHEFLAADARDEVLRALVPVEQLCDGAQQTIARVVSKLVVDALAVIEIDDREAQRLTVPLPARVLFLEALLVGVTAADARQRVDEQTALLRRALLRELGRAFAELSDLETQARRALRALGFAARFVVAEFLQRLRHRGEAFLHLHLDRAQVARRLDLAVDLRELALHRALETDGVVAAPLAHRHLPRREAFEQRELPRHVLE